MKSEEVGGEATKNVEEQIGAAGPSVPAEEGSSTEKVFFDVGFPQQCNIVGRDSLLTYKLVLSSQISPHLELMTNYLAVCHTAIITSMMYRESDMRQDLVKL